MGNYQENTAKNRKVLILSNICRDFEKKLEDFLKKLCGNSESFGKFFLNLVKLRRKLVSIFRKTY